MTNKIPNYQSSVLRELTQHFSASPLDFVAMPSLRHISTKYLPDTAIELIETAAGAWRVIITRKASRNGVIAFKSEAYCEDGVEALRYVEGVVDALDLRNPIALDGSDHATKTIEAPRGSTAARADAAAGQSDGTPDNDAGSDESQ